MEMTRNEENCLMQCDVCEKQTNRVEGGVEAS